MSYNESLNSNSNYPPMSQSQWNNAPFNQKELDEKEFDINVYQSLSKSTSVSTNDYALEGGYLYSIDGGSTEEINTSETDWIKAYQGETPNSLIKSYKKLLEFIRDKHMHCFDGYFSTKKINYLIDECDNWEVDDYFIEEA